MGAGLHGAFLLARGQARGLHYMEKTPEGAVRSFWAAAVCLPAFLALRLGAWLREVADEVKDRPIVANAARFQEGAMEEWAETG